MGEGTQIEWADFTFNPWIGCTKVSPACDHCYAEDWAERFAQADGFGCWRACRAFFELNYGLPFEGQVIVWRDFQPAEGK